MSKQVSSFATLSSGSRSTNPDQGEDSPDGMPDFDDPRVARAMRDLERDITTVDENNPRHMAHVLNKMKEVMPADQLPKELDSAIRRMERGEDLETIEESMGDELNAAIASFGDDETFGMDGPYDQDPGLYDM